MKIIGITSTSVLALLLASTSVFAQQEQKSEKQDQSEQKQSKHEQAKPEQQHSQKQQPQKQKQDENKQAQQHAQQQEKQDQNKAQQQAQQQQKHEQNKQAQQQRGNQQPQRTQEQQRVQQASWQQHRSQNWDSDHRTWQQRGGYHGYRIPDDRFRGYFGPDHGFRIYGLPFLVVGGYPRFQYEGYWISLVDPWPEYWGDNWYDNDDVYVAYVDNGYYLFNRRYPSVGIAISFSM